MSQVAANRQWDVLDKFGMGEKKKFGDKFWKLSGIFTTQNEAHSDASNLSKLFPTKIYSKGGYYFVYYNYTITKRRQTKARGRQF